MNTRNSILVLAALGAATAAAAAGAARAQCLTKVAYGDPPRTGALAVVTQQDCYRFDGKVGEVFRLRFWAIAGFDGRATIQRPDFTTLCTPRNSTGERVCTLDQNGVYRLLIDSASGTRIGSYEFAIQRLDDPVNCEPICYGNSFSAAISNLTEAKCYVFPGSKDKMVQIALSTSAGFDGRAEIIDSSGAVVCQKLSTGTVTCTLPSTGRYSLHVGSQSLTRTGSYSVAIRCTTPPCECTAVQWSYGAGHPGTNGVPALTATGNPVLGTLILVTIGNSRGVDTPALLLTGTGKAETPTAYGGSLLVGDPLAVFPILPNLPAAGGTLPLQIPNDNILCNVCVHMQVIEADPGASQRLSFTPGLTLVLGR